MLNTNIMKTCNLIILINLLVITTQYLKAQTNLQFGPDGHVKIEEGSGGFIASLDSGDRFSRDHDVIGDVDGDGVLDLVVGARSDDDGATDAGAVYILFMNNNGSVKSNQKISMLSGGFTDTLNESSFFGYGVAGIGDYNNDNIPDIAVTASNTIYIIHLNTNGTVKNLIKNTGIVSQGLSAVGDLNNDGRIDIVACNPSSNDGGQRRGAIQILFFNSNSMLITSDIVTISSTQGGFGTGLENDDRFGGREVTMLGDLDNDGNKEMAVGAFMSDGGKGAVWILSLDNTTFNVTSKIKITEGLNGFTDTLTDTENPNGTFGANFGHAMCSPGDLNGDGIPDLITGANQQNEGWGYILYLNSDKTVKTYTRINNTDGGFNLTLDTEERFSRSISFIGDLRGDGSIAVNFGGGAGGTGTLYLLFFKPCNFTRESGFNRWRNGNILFTNWSHSMQMVIGDVLSFEQCTFKAFETDATYITYNFNDGRCICMDSNATLTTSSELSTAFTNQCFSGFLSTKDYTNNPYQNNIYPNPTKSNLVLKTQKTSFSNQDTIQLYSIVGELMYTSEITLQETSIDLSTYTNGIYILVVKNDNLTTSFKVLKE